MLKQLGWGALDLLYPPRCLVCGAAADRPRDHFCAECRLGLCGDRAIRCPRCATTVGPHSLIGEACAACRREPPSYARTLCLGSYRRALRVAVLRIKHASGEGLAELLGMQWAATRGTLTGGPPVDAVVPVPPHWRRRLARGYDDCGAIARGIAVGLGVPLRGRWLWRVRATAPQKTLNQQARWVNLHEAFRARPAVAGRHVLLVDDVMTSGATAEEASAALRGAGAARVTVAVLARTTAGEADAPAR